MALPPNSIGQIWISNMNLGFWLAVGCSWKNSCLVDHHIHHCACNVNIIAIDKLDICSCYYWSLHSQRNEVRQVYNEECGAGQCASSHRTLLQIFTFSTFNETVSWFWWVYFICFVILVGYGIVCYEETALDQAYNAANESGRVMSASCSRITSYYFSLLFVIMSMAL